MKISILKINSKKNSQKPLKSIIIHLKKKTMIMMKKYRSRENC